MRQQFGDFDGSRTVGDLAGLGPRTQPPAPGVAPASAPLPPLNPNAGPRVANLPPVDPNATALPVPPIPPSVTPPAPNPNAAVQVPPAVTGDANMTAVKQAATGLLAMPEADAAVAYGPTVKALQAQGFAMNAPPEYPGHAALQALVSGNVPTAPGAGAQVAGPGATAQPPAPYQVASNAPVPPPLPPNQMAPGGERGPPAPTAAPAQTSLPRMADVPSGMARPEAQQAQQLLRRATQIELLASQTPKDLATQQAAKAAADNLRLRAQQLLQTDSVVQTQEGQFHPMTGALDKPVANYHETSPGSGIWVGGPGADPRFQPPGRLVVGPDGTVYQTGVGGATVLEPSNPAAIAARKAAEAQGTETGKDVAKQLPALVEQGRNATQAIGNIDYGMSQLAKASQGGINTGYFSGALTEVQSALKSLGLPTDRIPFINVDPSAIGNIQTAQKTLAIVSSAILKQALGDSQITDAKIQHFIHAQPGIETDPQALGRVLNWARSQFVYEGEMSRAAMKEAADSPIGALPLNWQARYYRDKGFAPIYNPGSGEMQQPEGQAPSREPPPTSQSTGSSVAPNRDAAMSGQLYTDPKGNTRRKP